MAKCNLDTVNGKTIFVCSDNKLVQPILTQFIKNVGDRMLNCSTGILSASELFEM